MDKKATERGLRVRRSGKGSRDEPQKLESCADEQERCSDVYEGSCKDEPQEVNKKELFDDEKQTVRLTTYKTFLYFV